MLGWHQGVIRHCPDALGGGLIRVYAKFVFYYIMPALQSRGRPHCSTENVFSSSSQLTCASGPQAAHIHGGCARVAASVRARSVHLHVRLASLRKAHALIAQFDAPAQNSLTC